MWKSDICDGGAGNTHPDVVLVCEYRYNQRSTNSFGRVAHKKERDGLVKGISVPHPRHLKTPLKNAGVSMKHAAAAHQLF